MSLNKALNYVDQIVRHENLYWAWEKAKRFYKPGELWYDAMEVACFEGNLENELRSIRENVIAGRYITKPIIPLPLPKGKGDIRQIFYLSVRDQVTWIALVNIVGQYFEQKMPPWSYGNRLYRAIWYDTPSSKEKQQIVDFSKEFDISEDMEERLQWIPHFGMYSNTKGLLYRKWHQSWPLYRREIRMALSAMQNGKDLKGDLHFEPREKDHFVVHQLQKQSTRLSYLNPKYWEKSEGFCYWASFDLKRFFPSVPLEIIRNHLIQDLDSELADQEYQKLVYSLTTFRIDPDGYDTALLEKDFGIGKSEIASFPYIPTGLMVAGFLTNVALLKTDQEIVEELKSNREIAHFRFVDDNFVLAKDFDKLVAWILEYQNRLKRNGLQGLCINEEKYQPEALRKGISDRLNKGKEYSEAKKSCEIDPALPSPLTNATLQKVSNLANQVNEILDEQGEEDLLRELEFMISTKIDGLEIREDTRISFSAAYLVRIAPNYKPLSSRIAAAKLKQFEAEVSAKDLKKELNSMIMKKDNKGANVAEQSAEGGQWKEEKDAKRAKELESKMASQKEIAQKAQKEVGNLKSRQQSMMFVRQKANFSTLLDGINKFPSKWRLWTRAIQFCYFTGYNGLEELLGRIEMLLGDGKFLELTADYCRFTVWQEITCYAIKALKELVRSEIEDEERACLQSFLAEAYQLSGMRMFEVTGKNVPSYLRTTQLASTTCWRTLSLLFQANSLNLGPRSGLGFSFVHESPSHQVGGMNIMEFYGFKNELAERYLPKFRDLWMLAYGNEYGGYQFLESLFRDITRSANLKKMVASEPSLAVNSLRLFPTEEGSFGMLLAIESAIKGGTKENELDNGEFVSQLLTEYERLTQSSGLLLEIHERHRLALKAVDSPAIDSLSPYLLNKQKTLVNWIKYNSKLERKEAPNSGSGFGINYDPRLAEWTSLEITRQIAENLIWSKRSSKRTADARIHPRNFVVPQNWFGKKPASFLAWKTRIRKSKISQVETMLQVKDERYVPLHFAWGLEKGGSKMQDTDLPEIMGIGGLLMGLIRRSFDLPAAWNPNGLRSSSNFMFQDWIENHPVSSLTLAILRACRSKTAQESHFNHIINNFELLGLDSTYVEKTLIIRDLDYLIECIEMSQAMLERNLYGSDTNSQRQLLPMNLIQLSDFRDPFATTPSDDNDEE